MGLRDRLQQLAFDSVVVAGETTKQGMHAYGNLLRRANIGVGPVRFTPEGAGYIRDVFIEQLREALDIPEPPPAIDGSDDHHVTIPLRAPDPAAVARALLEMQPKMLRDLIQHDQPDAAAAKEAARRLTSNEHLRARFAALLDPEHSDVELFPAFISIVSQLSPDQARMLRHLHVEGPAPAVDVVSLPRFAVSGGTGRLVAQSLNVLTDRSGGDDAERGPAHLHNLIRLGLVAIEDRELPDHGDYQLIEAGHVYESVVDQVAATSGQRAKTVRQTVRLTPLGQELCRLSLTAGLEPGAASAAVALNPGVTTD